MRTRAGARAVTTRSAHTSSPIFTSPVRRRTRIIRLILSCRRHSRWSNSLQRPASDVEWFVNSERVAPERDGRFFWQLAAWRMERARRQSREVRRAKNCRRKHEQLAPSLFARLSTEDFIRLRQTLGSEQYRSSGVESAGSAEFIERARCGCAEDRRLNNLRSLAQDCFARADASARSDHHGNKHK